MMSSDNFKTIFPSDLTTQNLHRYLLGSVAPRPIALASTLDKDGNVNLSPFSFFNVFSARPPIMIFSPARRGTDNTQKDTFYNVSEVKEVCINVVTMDIVQQVSLSSTSYPRGINEFVKSGLTEIASVKIAPPRVAESPVAFECEVRDIIELGDNAGAGNLVICEVVAMHFNKENLDDLGMVDTTSLHLVGRMGDNWYARAFGESLFEIEKPVKSMGIGVDALPHHVLQSEILTGNDLGKLGNSSSLPTEKEIEDLRSNKEFNVVLRGKNLSDIHILAKQLIAEGRRKSALTLLCATE